MRGDLEATLKAIELPEGIRLFEEIIIEKRVLFPAILDIERRGPRDHVFYLEQGRHKLAVPVKAGTKPEYLDKIIKEGLIQLAQLIDGGCDGEPQ